MSVCTNEGCENKAEAHGLCNWHGTLARRAGIIKTRTADPVARFWEKVDKDGPVPEHRPELGPCWLWTGTRVLHGYGAVRWMGKMRRAHRVAWEIANGAPPPDDLDVLHACDNPPCVRPDHVSPGTNDDNVADKIAKGRQIRGEQVIAAKLTEEQVLEMRALRSDGKSVEELGTIFGVAPAHASRICLGRTWKHLGAALAPKRPGKLSDDQVAELRVRRAAGESRGALAAAFGICKAHVTRVALGRYW